MTIAEDREITTALALVQRAATQAEVIIGDHVKEPIMLEYVNDSLSELHDILTESFGDCFDREHSFPAGSDDQLLPDGVLRVIRLFRSEDGIEVKRATLPQMMAARAAGGAGDLRYRLIGNRIRFSEPPGAAVLMEYAGTFVRLRDLGDSINFTVPVDWGRFVVYDLTARLMALEDSDYVFWEGRKEELRKRFKEIATQRDLSPQPIEDRELTDFLES